MSYFAVARDVLSRAMSSTIMDGLAHRGTYVRVLPPTPQAPRTTQVAEVWVMFERYEGRPVGDVPWQPTDRKALIQQAEMPAFGLPRLQDQLRMPEGTYHVVNWWEEAPGLLWSLQVRQ